jgi:hypothetical protein
MIDSPKASEPKQDRGEDSAVPQKTEQQGCSSKRDYTSKSYCHKFCSILLKNRTAEQWIAIGTWALAGVTIGLLFDARHASERQLRAYVGIQTQGLRVICPDCDNPNRPASKKMLPENQVTFFLKNFGITPAYHPTICAGIAPVPLGANLTREYVEGEFAKCNAIVNPVIMPTIWPGESRPYAFPFFKTEIDALIGTRQRHNDAFFYARVSYTDIFREPHNSYFCFQYVYQADPFMDVLIGCGSTYVTDD